MVDEILQLYTHKKIGDRKAYYIDTDPSAKHKKILFMVPPWANPAFTFALSIPVLAQEFRVIVPDFPWWAGFHERWEDVAPTYDAFIEFLQKFITSFAFKDYAVLGYSMGCSFISHLVNKKEIPSPSKIVFVSGMYSQIDGTYSKWLKLQMSIVKRLLPVSPIVEKPFKRVVKYMYSRDLKRSPIKQVEEKRALYTYLLSFIPQIPMKDAYLPVLTIPKCLDLDTTHFSNSELMFISNRYEPFAYQMANRRVANLFGMEPVSIEAWGHRHFAFEPEKSLGKIQAFLRR